MSFTVWYHDPAEVDPALTWTGIATRLHGASITDIRNCRAAPITALFRYARPDAVVSWGDVPLISIEQTRMNPSGHNIPQRFSCLIKAAESQILGICYYPEFARRTYSDRNPRYLNIRVPLAQFRLMEIFPESVSLSVFWPTSPDVLPSTEPLAQSNLARVVDDALELFQRTGSLEAASLKAQPAIATSLAEMDRVISQYGTARRYRRNATARPILPAGFPAAKRGAAQTIDPPGVVTCYRTVDFVTKLETRYPRRGRHWYDVRNQLLLRPLTMCLKGTANRKRNDSEHPWPGYLTLMDILYCRDGRDTRTRFVNLAYELPNVQLGVFQEHLRGGGTLAHISVNSADLLLFDRALLTGDPPGRPQQIVRART